MDTETDDTLELEGFEDEIDALDDEQDGEQGNPDNAVIRKMRADLREANREKAELQKRVAATAKVEPGPKPTLEGCDWQDDKYEAALEKWTVDKLASEKAEPVAEKGVSGFEASAAAFQSARVALTTATPEAEDIILDVDRAMGTERSGFIIHAFKDKAPELMVAIGQNADLMDELADMDPVEMIVRVARMQTKEAPVARDKPDIDEPVQGRPPARRGVDKAEVKLEAEAERTGNYNKLFEYRRQKRGTATA